MRTLGRTSRLILTVLAKSPSHGYGVIRWVKSASGGTETLAVGSVYGAMDKLESQGLIEHDRDEIEQGRKRRYFRVTDDGRARLAAEVVQLSTEIDAARLALGIEGLATGDAS